MSAKSLLVKVELLWVKGKGRMEASKNFWAEALKDIVLKQLMLLKALIMHTRKLRPIDQKAVDQGQPVAI